MYVLCSFLAFSSHFCWPVSVFQEFSRNHASYGVWRLASCVRDKTCKTDVACKVMWSRDGQTVHVLFFCVKLLMQNCNIPSSRYDAAVSLCVCVSVYVCVCLSLLDVVGDMIWLAVIHYALKSWQKPPQSNTWHQNSSRSDKNSYRSA